MRTSPDTTQPSIKVTSRCFVRSRRSHMGVDDSCGEWVPSTPFPSTKPPQTKATLHAGNEPVDHKPRLVRYCFTPTTRGKRAARGYGTQVTGATTSRSSADATWQRGLSTRPGPPVWRRGEPSDGDRTIGFAFDSNKDALSDSTWVRTPGRPRVDLSPPERDRGWTSWATGPLQYSTLRSPSHADQTIGDSSFDSEAVREKLDENRIERLATHPSVASRSITIVHSVADDFFKSLLLILISIMRRTYWCFEGMFSYYKNRSYW